jgi:acetylserotonin O-methyltransferase
MHARRNAARKSRRPVAEKKIVRPDPTNVLDLLFAFRLSKTMFDAVALGVFDALADGPKPLDELARALGANRDALERLLDACVGLRLLSRDQARYANTPEANTYLCTRSPDRLTGYVRYSNDVMWKLWANLGDAVREGTHRWKQTFGWDGPVFANLYRTDEARREFLMGMNGFGQISSPQVAAAFDLSRFRSMVDLGGATGHLAIAACSRYSGLEAIVFDLPQVLPLAREIIDASPVANRINLVAGDFFTDPLPEAGLYAMGRIVHDWPEDKILRLLSRIHERLPSGGGLLLAEKLLNDDKSGPPWATMQSLNMLVCVEGKERTLAEYQSLLTRAGFRDVEGFRTSSPLDAILAIKP